MQKYHDEPKQYKGYLKSALATFGDGFHDVETYTANRPSAGYLRRLLASDSFIALAAIKNDEIVRRTAERTSSSCKPIPALRTYRPLRCTRSWGCGKMSCISTLPFQLTTAPRNHCSDWDSDLLAA